MHRKCLDIPSTLEVSRTPTHQVLSHSLCDQAKAVPDQVQGYQMRVYQLRPIDIVRNIVLTMAYCVLQCDPRNSVKSKT
jgi:hypothetical protein